MIVYLKLANQICRIIFFEKRIKWRAINMFRISGSWIAIQFNSNLYQAYNIVLNFCKFLTFYIQGNFHVFYYTKKFIHIVTKQTYIILHVNTQVEWNMASKFSFKCIVVLKGTDVYNNKIFNEIQRVYFFLA